MKKPKQPICLMQQNNWSSFRSIRIPSRHKPVQINTTCFGHQISINIQVFHPSIESPCIKFTYEFTYARAFVKYKHLRLCVVLLVHSKKEVMNLTVQYELANLTYITNLNCIVTFTTDCKSLCWVLGMVMAGGTRAEQDNVRLEFGIDWSWCRRRSSLGLVFVRVVSALMIASHSLW